LVEEARDLLKSFASPLQSYERPWLVEVPIHLDGALGG
jgi:hypothetical protein